jgi:hypothetical protein
VRGLFRRSILLLVPTWIAAACGGGAPAEVTERLWVSALPTDTREEVDAFVVTDVRGRSLGAFYRGSAYRGRHELFTWKRQGDRKGEIHLLHAQTRHAITLAACEPRRGFDHCIELGGDPTGVERYYSRKRWAVPRRGTEAGPSVVELAGSLAVEDADLAALAGVEP